MGQIYLTPSPEEWQKKTITPQKATESKGSAVKTISTSHSETNLCLPQLKISNNYYSFNQQLSNVIQKKATKV